MTEVYFIRHAEPNYENHDDRTRELTQKGLKDRVLATQYLMDKDIQLVFSSPFKRAVDTVADFADRAGLPVELIEDFRERRIESVWIEDYSAFARRQWSDFSYKFSDGECLKEVQERNIRALTQLLQNYPDRHIVVGSHGTALSTIINYYDPTFQYDDFERIRTVMPWIVHFSFDGLQCVRIEKVNPFMTGG
ncbi:MAG: histidine phosphatase family protein [Clostridia bacterium]|nr:histidine phosphatase family protein [Clostridia bacterium]